MRLYKKPEYNVETVDITTNFGQRYKASGQPKWGEAQIMVEDHATGDQALEDTFNTLKYGPAPDLADAMHNGRKIDKIVFEKDNVILEGVRVKKMERSATFNGRLFTCEVDYMEYIDDSL